MPYQACKYCGKVIGQNFGWLNKHEDYECEKSPDVIDRIATMKRNKIFMDKYFADERKSQEIRELKEFLVNLINKQCEIDFNVKLHRDFFAVHPSGLSRKYIYEKYSLSELEKNITCKMKLLSTSDNCVLSKVEWLSLFRIIKYFYNTFVKKPDVQLNAGDMIFGTPPSPFGILPSPFGTIFRPGMTYKKFKEWFSVYDLIVKYPRFLYAPISINDLIEKRFLIKTYLDDPNNIEFTKLWQTNPNVSEAPKESESPTEPEVPEVPEAPKAHEVSSTVIEVQKLASGRLVESLDKVALALTEARGILDTFSSDTEKKRNISLISS